MSCPPKTQKTGNGRDLGILARSIRSAHHGNTAVDASLKSGNATNEVSASAGGGAGGGGATIGVLDMSRCHGVSLSSSWPFPFARATLGAGYQQVRNGDRRREEVPRVGVELGIRIQNLGKGSCRVILVVFAQLILFIRVRVRVCPRNCAYAWLYRMDSALGVIQVAFLGIVFGRDTAARRILFLCELGRYRCHVLALR